MKRKRQLKANPGQSMTFIAVVLAFMTPLIFGVIELSERQFQIALMEDALQSATRVGVQAMEYRAFASNRSQLEASRAIEMASDALARNLRATRGLEISAEAMTSMVTWTPLPNGGTCRFSDGSTMTFNRPALCAEMRPPLSGVGLWAGIRPTIRAAATLDRL